MTWQEIKQAAVLKLLNQLYGLYDRGKATPQTVAQILTALKWIER